MYNVCYNIVIGYVLLSNHAIYEEFDKAIRRYKRGSKSWRAYQEHNYKSRRVVLCLSVPLRCLLMCNISETDLLK